MTAKIISLQNYRSIIRDSANGVVFPQVYRVRGNYYDLDERGQLIGSDRPAPPCFTLSETDTNNLFNPTIELVEKLVGGIDGGGCSFDIT